MRARYAPRPDGDPDPGEIVWTWVPFEEDHSQGKDRPVLLVGSDGAWLLGVMLTSKDHSRDAQDEARWGRYWLDIGSGPWDAKGRDSEVRLDRVVRVDPDAVRREGPSSGATSSTAWSTGSRDTAEAVAPALEVVAPALAPASGPRAGPHGDGAAAARDD